MIVTQSYSSATGRTPCGKPDAFFCQLRSAYFAAVFHNKSDKCNSALHLPRSHRPLNFSGFGPGLTRSEAKLRRCQFLPYVQVYSRKAIQKGVSSFAPHTGQGEERDKVCI